MLWQFPLNRIEWKAVPETEIRDVLREIGDNRIIDREITRIRGNYDKSFKTRVRQPPRPELLRMMVTLSRTTYYPVLLQYMSSLRSAQQIR
jgi:hypothetical protein